MQSWAGAALLSLLVHGLLFHLTTVGLRTVEIALPVEAYLAPSNDWRSASMRGIEPEIASPGLETPLHLSPVPVLRPWTVPSTLEVGNLGPGSAGNVAIRVAPPTVARDGGSVRESSSDNASRSASTSAMDVSSGLDWQILQWLQRHRSYPRGALRAGLEGEVGVRFTLDRGGHLLHAEVERSSGFKLLDQAALELLQRAQPYPLPPLDQGIDRLELSLPVAYRIEPGRS